MEFCPTCGNMLQYEKHIPPFRFFCPTCPYVCQIENKVKIKRKQHLVKKDTEHIITQQELRAGNALTDATCPDCHFGRAYFKTMQIRSADEPETRFYMCQQCEKCWRED